MSDLRAASIPANRCRSSSHEAPDNGRPVARLGAKTDSAVKVAAGPSSAAAAPSGRGHRRTDTGAQVRKTGLLADSD